MALLGKGALVIWHDPAREVESDYNEWHSKEHMLERVGVPGFRRGLRYVALEGAPRYLNLYEVDELATLTSRPYLDRLNDPTAWTRRVVPQVHNNSRTLCKVIASAGGGGVCGFVLTVQLAAAPARSAQLCAWLADAALPDLAGRPGIIGAHLLEGDPAASRSGGATAEKRLRGRADAIADRVVLVGGYEAAALRAARDGPFGRERLVAHGAAAAPTVGLYQLMHAITEADLRA
jgi:hypothetical protein